MLILRRKTDIRDRLSCRSSTIYTGRIFVDVNIARKRRLHENKNMRLNHKKGLQKRKKCVRIFTI